MMSIDVHNVHSIDFMVSCIGHGDEKSRTVITLRVYHESGGFTSYQEIQLFAADRVKEGIPITFSGE